MDFEPRNGALWVVVNERESVSSAPGRVSRVVRIDAMIVYAFDPDAPSIAATPGAALRIEDVSDGLTLGNAIYLRVWTRSSVVKAITCCTLSAGW